jgi:hypothetical protein
LKWFLASILYSKPIRESAATETFRVFEERGVLTCTGILEMGWDGLVSLLDEGGYTRYDFSTAERLLTIFGNLERDYRGNFDMLYASASDSTDLERRIKRLGKGIGNTTVSVFLRDMRGIWPKANPAPTPLVLLGMKKLKIKDLPKFARLHRLNTVRLETALLRLGKDFLRKGKSFPVSA